ncbi:ribonuclease P protein subunit p25-like protein [Anarrhichthys ocellatus]|uniref:ribonuclease P protein subunit p25-like protein n=1 Tax=Anarrhichthys ocellatus TaxID=433405 RepID=UPI0012EE9A07|nr:ribonuclease P protein subunit p25-like protein [Anarrhichthys ocellatus]
MENYKKTRTVERPSVCPFLGLPPDTPEVRVRDGGKIRHPLRYALSHMEDKPRPAENEDRGGAKEGRPEDGGGAKEGQQEAGRTLCKQILLTASGTGVSKAITCAEIVKRRVKGLHQLTRVQFSTVDEVWDPLETSAGLDSLTVSRNLPSIWILLSRDTLDQSQNGYQEPGRHDALWASKEDGGGQRPGHKRKQGGGGTRGRGPGRQTGRSRDLKGQSGVN